MYMLRLFWLACVAVVAMSIGVPALAATPTVVGGNVHTLMLKADGTVWAVGRNGYGELGNGTLTDSNVPVRVSGLTDVIAVSSAVEEGGHSLALKSDGTVWAWGYNNYGQIGDGTTVDAAVPVQVPGLAGVTAIAAGGYYSVAVKSDGTVWSWGSNEYGQLGNGSTTTSYVPVQVMGLTGVVSVAAGYGHTMAIKSDGAVWGWGRNDEGQLGVGSRIASSVPVWVTGIADVKAISLSFSYTMVVKNDGTVWSWGNDGGRGGRCVFRNGGAEDDVPVQLPELAGVTAVSAGYYHSVFLKSDGTVWGCGNNGAGQLGIGGSPNEYGGVSGVIGISYSPVQALGLSDVIAIGAGAYHSLALKSDGTVWGWGYDRNGQIGIISWRFATIPTPSEIGGFFIHPPTVPVTPTLAILDGGGSHSVMLKKDGTVWAVGRNGYGELGDGTLTDSRAPVRVSGLTDVIAVSSGTEGGHSLALKSDGTVWAWGYNNSGQIGNGTTVDAAIPVQVPGLAGVIAIAAGTSYSVAVKSDGTVWSWGSNEYGQLGNGSTTTSYVPVQVTGLTDVVSVAAGYYHTMVIKSDGTVWGWGYNAGGQLGVGTRTNFSVPVWVTGIRDVKAMALSHLYTMVVKTDGTVWYWGSGAYGGLCIHQEFEDDVPVQSPGLAGVTAVSAGYRHSVLLKSDGTVWTCGSNSAGQLGIGVGDPTVYGGMGGISYSPVQALGLSDVIAIGAGAFHSLALKSDGTVWGWGANGLGQIGSVNTKGWPLSTIPYPIAGISLLDVQPVQTPAVPTLVSPSGTVATTTPTYTWNASAGATSYSLSVSDGSGAAQPVTYTAVDVGCGAGTETCSVTPSTQLSNGASYTWSVVASNGAGSSASSGSLSFSVDVPTAPAAPTLVSPSGTVATMTPTYTWNASAGATSYSLSVSNGSGSAQPVTYSAADVGCSAGTGTCSVTPPTQLTNGASYTWSVVASNSVGSSASSSSLSFSVDVPTAPAAPTLVSPSGTVATMTPTYTWNASAGATSYSLSVIGGSGTAVAADYSALSLGCDSGTGTCSVTPSTQLTNGASYTWSVVASNGVGSSASSSSLSFSVDVPTAPAAPTLVSPSGTVATMTPTYTWNASAGATSYSLSVSNGSGTPVSATYPATDVGCGAGTGTCSVTPSTQLTNGASYTWSVVASNGVGSSASSSSLSFTVNAPTAPAAPTLVSPSGTVATMTPTYTWNASAGATSYSLSVIGGSGTVVSADYSASSLGCDGGTGTCSVTPATQLTNGASYTWSVVASNGVGSSASSSGLSFTVNAPTAPAAPTLVSPSGTVATMTPTYTWNASAGATSYSLSVSSGSGTPVSATYPATDVGCGAGTGTCSVTPTTQLTNGASYTWSVVASNGVGSSASSSSLSFTVNAPTAPAAPTLVSPSGTVATMTPTYTWNASAGATSYSLSVSNGSGTPVSATYPAADVGCDGGAGTCSVTPTTQLTNGASYTWSVVASNGVGSSASSSSLSFTVNAPTAPAAPTLVSPSGTVATTTPTYTWNASAGATSYSLSVSNGSGTPVSATYPATDVGCGAGTGTCSVTPSAQLTNGASYTWSVVASNNVGSSASSSSLSFTVNAPTAPAAPTLVSPSGTVTSKTPTYTWNASAGATSYSLSVSNGSGTAVSATYQASSLGCGAGTGTCSVTPSAQLTNGASYTWSVVASNNVGSSASSSSLSFTVNAPTAPAAPTLVSPSGTVTSKTPTYTWNASAGATSYSLSVSNGSGTAVSATYQASSLGCGAGTGTCSVTPSTQLTNGASYTWSVVASNSVGSSASSSSLSFSVNAPIAPVAPTLVSPSGSVGSTTPTYSWNASAGATNYSLYVGDASGTVWSVSYSAASVGCAAGTGICSVTPSRQLTNGASYSWAVVASNSGGSSALSGGLSFSVNVPAVPTLVSPSGNVATKTPTYRWFASPGVTSYSLHVGDGYNAIVAATYSAAALGCGAGTGICSVTPTTQLLTGSYYAWYVLATNSVGSSAWSSGMAFKVDLTLTIPAVPTVVSPSGTVVSTTPTYTWTASQGATSYSLWVGNGSGAALYETYGAGSLSCGTGTCSVTPTTQLANGSSYSWGVLASNGMGSSAWSSALVLTVNVSPPATPALVSPSGSVASTTPTYTWNASAVAAYYSLYVVDGSGAVLYKSYSAAEAGCGAGTGTCSVRPTTQLANGSSYSWSVRANNIVGYSAWSSWQPLTVNLSLPAVPTLISPNGAASAYPMYRWYASPGATSYILYVGNGSGVAILAPYSAASLGCVSGTGICQVQLPNALAHQTDYSWFVQAINELGNSPWSSGLIFSTTIP